MTKEQVKKHGEVIKWFCDNTDKGVWSRRNDSGLRNWALTTEPNWESTYIFLQNDEYAEFRKALVDGKILEIYYKTPSTWKTITNPDFSAPASFYRIKPKFKVGDWVINPDGLVNKVTKVEDNETYYSDCKLWEPIRGEWCVFYEVDEELNESLHIEKFDRIDEYGNYVTTWTNDWSHCLPLEFVQTLKDK